MNDATARPRFFSHPVDAVLAATSRLSTLRFNAHAGLVADCSVGFALVGAGLWRGDIGIVAGLAIVIAGLLIFSLIEYCAHRWLFHARAGVFEKGHTQHHEEPLGYDALPFFLPPLIVIGLAALLTLLMPTSVALLLMGALSAGYAAYGIGHTAIHSLRFTRVLTRRWAAAHHIHHHHPESNFGVTTPLWDIVLGTRYVSNRTTPPQHG